MPCIRSPYHYRITWQIWFAAMGSIQHNQWLFHLTYKLLKNDSMALKLIQYNPFQEKPPEYIKIDRYKYELTNPYLGEKKIGIKEHFKTLTFDPYH